MADCGDVVNWRCRARAAGRVSPPMSDFAAKRTLIAWAFPAWSLVMQLGQAFLSKADLDVIVPLPGNDTALTTFELLSATLTIGWMLSGPLQAPEKGYLILPIENHPIRRWSQGWQRPRPVTIVHGCSEKLTRRPKRSCRSPATGLENSRVALNPMLGRYFVLSFGSDRPTAAASSACNSLQRSAPNPR